MHRRLALVGLAVGLVVVGGLFAFVYPTRTFLDQRSDLQKSQAQLEILRSENRELADEAERLNSDAEIERMAREHYGLLRPGERAYVIVPVPTTTTTTTTTTPAKR